MELRNTFDVSSSSSPDRSVCEGLRVSVTPAVPEVTESEADQGWGRLCLFLQRLGKKADSRGLNLAHCDLTATDLLELGEHTHTRTSTHIHNQRQKRVHIKFVPPSLRAFFISHIFHLHQGYRTVDSLQTLFPNMHHSPSNHTCR